VEEMFEIIVIFYTFKLNIGAFWGSGFFIVPWRFSGMNHVEGRNMGNYIFYFRCISIGGDEIAPTL
jgi:hypothetical protein